MAVMARALRKTVRKKRSRRSHLFGWLAVAFGVLMLVTDDGLNLRTALTAAAVALILIALLLEDRLTDMWPKSGCCPAPKPAVTVFEEGGFVSTTQVGRTEWKYDAIRLVAETPDFFRLCL